MPILLLPQDRRCFSVYLLLLGNLYEIGGQLFHDFVHF